METIPRKYQLKVPEFFKQNGHRILVADDPGLGKSLEALLCVEAVERPFPVVVVCPATVKWVWRNEIKKHLCKRSTVLQTLTPARVHVRQDAEFYIVNYDILAPTERKEGRPVYPGWVRWLRRIKPRTLIIDECHYLIDQAAKRTRACIFLANGDGNSATRQIPNVIALSGTPMTNRTRDLFPILHLLRPKIFKQYYSFCHIYAGPRKERWGWTFNGSSNVPELIEKLSTVMIRRTKEQVMEELPPKQYSVVPLDIDNDKEYQRAVTDFISWLTETYGDSRAANARQAEKIVQMGELLRLAAKGKMKNVLSWLDDFLAESDSKIIVFGVNRAVVEAIHKKYRQKSVLIYGGVSQEIREAATKKFQRDPKCRMFVGNIKAAGVAWSALGCSDVAFVQFPWTPAAVTQGADRAHGIGRGQEGVRTRVHFLTARGTIEETLAKILQRKQKQISRIMDGRGKGEQLVILDLLEQALLAKGGNSDRVRSENG